jgi:hypothetical protein
MKPFSRALFALLLLSLVSGLGCSKLDRSAPAAAAVAAPPPPPPAQLEARVVGRKALLEIHASIDVDVEKPERAKAMVVELDDFARTNGGYTAEARFGTDSGLTRLVLRVKPADLPALRKVLAGDGQIARDTETATDVTEAIADIDARLRSARIEEARILKLLEERWGTIADVLAAERALADVRQRIERLEAEQRVAQGRVDLATVDVSLRHPAAGNADEPVGTRLAEAAKDGVWGAKAVLVGLTTASLRAGPTLLLLASIAILTLLGVRRALRLARRRV